jgi:hypothetical protein
MGPGPAFVPAPLLLAMGPWFPCASPRCSAIFFICAAAAGDMCGGCCPRLLLWECPCCGVAPSTCASDPGAPPKLTCGGICVAAGLNACKSAAFAFAVEPAPKIAPEFGLTFCGDEVIADIGLWFTGITGCRGVASRGVEWGFVGGVACGVTDTVGVGC